VIARPVLRAHQLRSVGPGQRWLVELELTSDGRIHQRINEGTPEPAKSWTAVGRWTDLEAERQRLVADGWELD
jgi:hypothetical protein